ncbi:MAG: glycosyltransferase [Saprospiraceae bacterium]|nr:glycosyltransferase [Saprospiraceae bacterium]
MKILVLLPRVPYPLEKGDKLRAFHQVKQLSKNNEIILCALNDSKLHIDAIVKLKPFCESIYFINISLCRRLVNIVKALFNGNPLQIGYFYNNKAQRRIDSIIKEKNPEHIYCQLIRTAEYVKNLNIPKTLDYQDVFSAGIERRIEKAKGLKKILFKLEHNRLLKYEEEIFDYFNNKTIISKPDQQLIPHIERDKIHIIPNGVDYDFFKPFESEKKYDILFTGNMGYPPNINSVVFLAKKILPEVHKKNPEVNLVIVGANPHISVKALKSEKIIVTGWVKDMREFYAQSKIFIAPMQIGTGLQNKLLESMAMKLPCITSNLANDALCAENGKEILIGNSHEDYAKLIISLLENPVNAKEVAVAGYKFVHANYDWEKATQKLEAIIKS